MGGIAVSTVRSFASRARLYFAFTRPFTLLPPTFGVVSGALTAFGSAHNPDPDRCFSASVLMMLALGSMTAALLNADRKSTRLNSSHSQISYAVFCLKKKKNTHIAEISHTTND